MQFLNQPDGPTNGQMLTAAERRQVLEEWNATAADYPAGGCLHELFEAQAARTPDAAAVAFGGERLTYRELDERANRLAHHLRALGVGPEVLVGVCLERSLEMVVGLLGVLKAGGAYVPLDPAYPAERLAFMLADARAPILLTQAALVERVSASAARVVCLDSDWPAIARRPAAGLGRRAAPANLAYVIYTSGSTGRPKGVMNTHGGIVNRLLWMQEAYGLGPSDRVLQKTPFSFDVSVWEFFWPLLAGAELVVARSGGHRDPQYLAELIAGQEITTLHFVPAMLRSFLESGGARYCASVRRVFCSGEALPHDLLTHFFAQSAAELHNLYGPTEAAVDVTYWACDPAYGAGKVPIGRPIANARVYVLDRRLQPVPVGVAGELHIAGAGVARGYLGRPDLTAERFIPDPFAAEPGGRLYKTGDLVRYLADGNLEFLGRLDDQVKIRGFRVEPGEVEAALARHPAVREGAVAVREGAAGEKRLVAYLVPRQPSSPAVGEVWRALRRQLPEHMIPAAFVVLEALPLTPSGKIDRRALPAPDSARPELGAAYLAPRTPLEETLAEIWSRSLGLERVGIRDNFFELGGHSLLATRIVARIRQALQIEVPLRTFFEAPSIAELSDALALTGSQVASQSFDNTRQYNVDAYLIQLLNNLAADEADKLLLETDFMREDE